MNSYLLLGFYVCQFWWKSIKKCKRESARWRTQGQRQTGFIICLMLYAIAMGRLIIRINIGVRKLESLGYCMVYLFCDPVFNHFGRLHYRLTTDRRTDRRTTTAYTALAGSHSKTVIFETYMYVLHMPPRWWQLSIISFYAIIILKLDNSCTSLLYQ